MGLLDWLKPGKGPKGPPSKPPKQPKNTKPKGKGAGFSQTL
jgi:hypothetical protein